MNRGYSLGIASRPLATLERPRLIFQTANPAPATPSSLRPSWIVIKKKGREKNQEEKDIYNHKIISHVGAGRFNLKSSISIRLFTHSQTPHPPIFFNYKTNSSVTLNNSFSNSSHFYPPPNWLCFSHLSKDSMQFLRKSSIIFRVSKGQLKLWKSSEGSNNLEIFEGSQTPRN